MVPGLMSGISWIVLDNEFILVPSGRGRTVNGEIFYWECRFSREKVTKCTYRMTTRLMNDYVDNEDITNRMDVKHLIVNMMKTCQHTCRQNVTHIIEHKFRTKINKMAELNFKFKYARTFEKEKKTLLNSIVDAGMRERVRQILPSEEEFRSAAHRAKKKRNTLCSKKNVRY